MQLTCEYDMSSKFSYNSFIFDLTKENDISYYENGYDYKDCRRITLDDKSAVDDEGYTAICYACANGVPPEYIIHLINLGFTTSKCSRGKSPLQYACQCMSVDVIKALLGGTVTYMLMEYNDGKLVPSKDTAAIYISNSSNICKVSKYDILSACSLPDSSILDIMLQQVSTPFIDGEAFIDTKDKNNNTPLILACTAQCYGSVDLILKQLPDLYIKNKDDADASNIAESNNDIGIKDKLNIDNIANLYESTTSTSYATSLLKSLIYREQYEWLNKLSSLGRLSAWEIQKIRSITALDNDKLNPELRH